jgi:hypothetical protein
MMACLEGLNLERSLVVGDCLGQLVAVQVEVDVDDVGKQPLGLPPVLLWVLHLRTVLSTVQLRECPKKMSSQYLGKYPQSLMRYIGAQ